MRHRRPPRPARHAQACALAVWAGLGCPSAPDVGPASERTVDGPLALDERDLTARVDGDTLVVDVPALSRVPLLAHVRATLLSLDGTPVAATQRSTWVARPLGLHLRAGGNLATLDQQADRVLLLRIAVGPYEVVSLRSVLELLHSPALALHVPARVPAGTDAPLLLGAEPGDGTLRATVRGAGAALGLPEVTPAGLATTFRAPETGVVTVEASAQREGGPRHIHRDVQVVPGGDAYLVLSRPVVGPGECLDVLVVGLPAGPGTRLSLVSASGHHLTWGPVEALSPDLGRGLLCMPGSSAPGPATVGLLDNVGLRAQAPVTMGPRSGLRARMSLDARESGGQVTVTLLATDQVGRPLLGTARLEVVAGTRLTARADGVLVDGAFTLEANARPLLGGAASGVVTVLASVTGEEGLATGTARVLGLGGAALELRLRARACVAQGPCAVEVEALDLDGLPVAAQGVVDVAWREWPLVTGPDGHGRVEVEASAPGLALVQAHACLADGRCGWAWTSLLVSPPGTGSPSLELAPQAVVGQPTRTLLQAPAGALGTLQLDDGVASPFPPVTRVASLWRAPQGRADVDLLPRLPGLHVARSATLAPDTRMTFRRQPVLVGPVPGPAPAMTVDGAALQARGGQDTLVLQASCGPGEVGWGWTRGLLGADARHGTAVGWEGRTGTLTSAAVAAGLSTPRAEDMETEPDATAARALLSRRTLKDLERVADEARALVEEGTLTATMTASWLERRRHVYVDPFGQPYLLQPVAGRLHLSGAGPDEVRGTPDDLDAWLPLERLVSSATHPDPTSQAQAASPTPTFVITQSELASGEGLATLDHLPGCGLDAVVRAVRLGPGGTVGAVEVPASRVLAADVEVWAPAAMRVGDVLDLPFAVRGAGLLRGAATTSGALESTPVAILGAARGAVPFTGLLHATARFPGPGHLSVALASSALPRRAAVDVRSDAITTPWLALQPCPGTCTLHLAPGDQVLLWRDEADGCSAGLDRLAETWPCEPAALALASALAAPAGVPGAERHLQLTLAEAVTRAPDDDLSLVLALQALASTHPHPPLRHPDSASRLLAAAMALTQPSGQVEADLEGDALAGVARLAHGLAAWEPGRAAAVARGALEESLQDLQAEPAALALLALQAAGAVSGEDVDRVEALVADGPPGAAGVLAQVLALRGRAGEARAWLEAAAQAGDAWGGPGTPLSQAGAVGGWCQVALSSPVARGEVVVRGAQGEPVARWPAHAAAPLALVSAAGGTHVVAGGVQYALMVREDARPWSQASVVTRRDRADLRRGEQTTVSLLNVPPTVVGQPWVRLSSGGGLAVLPSAVQDAQALRRVDLPDRGQVWMQVPAPALPGLRWALRALASGQFRASQVELWLPRTSGTPLTDAPPLVTVTP